MVRRTSLNLDFELVAEARDALGTKGTTETVHRALQEAVRDAKLRRLAEWTFEHLSEEEQEELDRDLDDAHP